MGSVLGGCASVPPPRSGEPQAGSVWTRDGAEPNPPADLAQVPDAEPQLEPIRSGGPNKPYEIAGRSYAPITEDRAYTEQGQASWYGRKFHGRRTSSGELYNMYAMTAAHPTLPIPSYARVRNPANGREIVVRINDRGPFHPGRIVDLSYTAALKLDVLRGAAPVELNRITFEAIRTGAWRRGSSDDAARVAAREMSLDDVAPAAAGALLQPISALPADLAAAPPLPAGVVAMTPGAAPTAVADGPADRAHTAPARGFWIQLGAFRERGGAEGFQLRVATELDWIRPLLTLFSDAALTRLQAGPYPTRDDARHAAERVREALRLAPVIVERR